MPRQDTWEQENAERTAEAAKQRRFVRFVVSIAAVVIVGLLSLFWVIHPVHVAGNEIAVVEDWDGIEPNPVTTGTRFLFPAYRKTAYVYDIGIQTFVMNNTPHEKGETGAGRAEDVYKIQSAEGQDMKVSMTFQYHLDSGNIISVHKSIRTSDPAIIGERIIRPVLMRVVKDKATVRDAIHNYSGEGLVSLQKDITETLSDSNGELRQKGIIVDTFVIEHIGLDPDYIGEIQKKQVAQQRTLRAVEETKASDAEALQAKAQAQADLNKRVVEGERDKQVMVLAAEAAKERTRLEAEAEKIKLVTTAEGTKEAKTLEAAGILAVGQAEAAAQKLRLEAYNAPGSETFVRVEVAKALAQGMSGIKGYVPEGVNITTIGQGFMDALNNFLGSRQIPAESVPAGK
jgi:regulator of protease activity HflC (stomatin/prohibitin superfamily)